MAYLDPNRIAVQSADSINNTYLQDVVGNKTDTIAGDSLISSGKQLKDNINEGSSTTGRAMTATLRVSPDGDDSDGSSWTKAYTTIQAALDAASTDANDCTLILIAPHPTYYDINTTGNPTWTGNYEIKGTHRLWAPVRNQHNDATCVMKFTGKVSVEDLAIFSTDNGVGGSVSGLIFTKSGYRVRQCGFNSESATHALNSIHIDGSAGLINGGRLEDVEIRGTKTVTTGLYINAGRINTTRDINFHNCLNAIQIIDATSDSNYFDDIEIGNCTIGINLDAGDGNHFRDMRFHDCDTNIDDEVGNHFWNEIYGSFPIGIEPDDFTGVALATGDGANIWGTSTEVRAAATSTTPFTVVDISIEADATEKFRIRLTGDDSIVYFCRYSI